MAGWLGGLGVGMSSAPTPDLKQTWNSFMLLALCCPLAAGCHAGAV